MIFALLVVACAFGPGYLVLRAFTRLERLELWASASAVGFLSMGAASMVGYVAHVVDRSRLDLLLFAGTLLAAALRRRIVRIPPRLSSPPEVSPADRQAVLLFGLFLSILVTVTAITPAYGGGHWAVDWILGYDISCSISAGAPPTDELLARTPLFAFVHAWIGDVLGDSFEHYQLASCAIDASLVPPAYLLAKRLLGPRIALLATTTIVLSPWVTHLAWYPWSKSLAISFVLLAAYFASKKELIVAGLFGGAAYMAHPLALFPLVGLLAVTRAPKLVAAAAAVVLPWHIWIVSTVGFARFANASPGAHAPEGILRARLHNALFSVVPADLLRGASFEALPSFYFNPLMGCLTITGSVLVLCSLRRPVWGGDHRLVVAMAASSYVLGVLVHPTLDEAGVFHNTMPTTGILALIYLWRVVRERWHPILLVGIAVEHLVGVWGFAFGLRAGLLDVDPINRGIQAEAGHAFFGDRPLGATAVAAALVLAVTGIIVLARSTRGETA